MKGIRDMRPIVTVLSLIVIALVVVVVTACGGGTETTTTTVEGGQDDGSTGVVVPSGTTTSLGLSVDPLSSFQPKDPFVQQAQATTTLAAATTVSVVTTTTVRVTATTVQHSVYVGAINSVPTVTVNYSVDGYGYTLQPLSSRLTFSWGYIEVYAVDTGSPTNTVTFRRTGPVEMIPMKVGDTAKW